MPRCDASALHDAPIPRSARAWAARADDLLATLAFPPSSRAHMLALERAAEVGAGIRRLGAARHRQALATGLRAKGGAQERTYVRRAARP